MIDPLKLLLELEAMVRIKIDVRHTKRASEWKEIGRYATVMIAIDIECLIIGWVGLGD